MIILILLITMLTISTKQLNFYREPLHDYNILSGVTGSGKSWIANLKWYQTIIEAPKNSLFLQTGNTEESLWDNITGPLLAIDKGIGSLDYKAVANKKRIVVKATGTNVVCTGANTDNAQDRIQGKNINGWYGDEIVKQPKTFVDMALSRCRTIKDKKMIMTTVLWTCNPDSPSHYIKTNYVDDLEIDVANWYFGFNDNPYIDKAYVEKVKKNFSGVFYDRMILGKWTLAEGCIYKEFSRDKHVVDVIPEIREYHLGVDWGYKNPMVYMLIGETGDNEYYVVDEWVNSGRLIDDELKAELIKAFPQYEFNTNAFCDPSRPEQIRQLSDLFPLLTVNPAENDVNDGISEVAKYFKMRDNGRYGLHIHSRCTHTITELENYRWKENKTGTNKDEPLKENDHCMDALRYVIYSRRTGFSFDNAPDIQGDYMFKPEVVGNRRL